MKIKLMEQVTGPSGERFSDEAYTARPIAFQWVIDWDRDENGRLAKQIPVNHGILGRTIVLTPIPPATKVERIKVEEGAYGLLCVEGQTIATWAASKDFRGAVYIHPMSKSEQVFSFTHPVFIRPAHGFMAEPFPWLFTRDEWHTAMLWPSFIEVER